MNVIIHNRIEILEKVLPKWELLKKKFHDITVFQDIEWIKSWWEYKKKERKIIPYIVEVKKENKTIGIIPLYLYNKEFAGFFFRVLKPIGIYESDYLIPIISKDYSPTDILKKAMEKIYEDKANWDCLDWGDILEGSIFDSAFNNELLGRPKLVKRKRTNVCPQLLLDKDIEHIKSNINKRFLKEVLYKERRLKREGKLKFNKVKSETEIEPIMNKFFELHRKRWRNTSTPSQFENIKEREYLMQAAKNLFKSNLLYLAYLSHDDEIAVAHFGMSDGKRNYLYLHAFNMRYRKYSMGNVFAYNLILDSYKENYEVVDFLRGDEGYKEKWGSIDKFNVKYLFFSRSLKSLLFKLINNTYYSKQFSQKSKIKQVFLKLVVRGCTFLIGINDNIRQRAKSI